MRSLTDRRRFTVFIAALGLALLGAYTVAFLLFVGSDADLKAREIVRGFSGDGEGANVTLLHVPGKESLRLVGRILADLGSISRKLIR